MKKTLGLVALVIVSALAGAGLLYVAFMAYLVANLHIN